MGETSKLDGQRTCLRKSVSARLIEVMGLTVEGIKFCLLLYCREVAHFLTRGWRAAFALSFISKS
jgi:hypothetical protein